MYHISTKSRVQLKGSLRAVYTVEEVYICVQNLQRTKESGAQGKKQVKSKEESSWPQVLNWIPRVVAERGLIKALSQQFG